MTNTRTNPSSLFMMLFNIFRLDINKLHRTFGKPRKYTISDLNKFKLACYLKVKEFFFTNPYNPEYISSYRNSEDLQHGPYVGKEHFELEFDLLWSVWYAYTESIVNQNPSIMNNMFDLESPFRKMFSDTNFFNNFIGYNVPIFQVLRIGSYISRARVASMFIKLTSMKKKMGKSSFPNQHAIKNALDIVGNYLEVRHPKMISSSQKLYAPDFFINDNLISGRGILLPKPYIYHLKGNSYNNGLFPFSAEAYHRNHPNDYQRCSNFKLQVGTLAADYSKFIQDRLVSKFSDLRNDKILVVDSVNGKNSPKPIQDLLKLVESFCGLDDFNFKNPSHPAIIGMAKAKLSDYVLATELPVWRKVGAKLVTGHIDLVLLIGDNLFVLDYKPGDKADPNANVMSKSFLMSLPQIAAYSKLHRSQYNIKKIYCVTFNEKGQAWIYQDKVLDSLENLLIAKGHSSWLIWKKYIV
jgi:hypothetical protein